MSDRGRSALSGYEGYLSRPVGVVADDLESFAALLKKWQPAQNLVSRETLDNMWTRHMRDSLQLIAHLTPSDVNFLDIGSGGGFPAIPMAVALVANDRQFTLVESNRRKCSFLRTVGRELSLPLRVADSRVEALDPANFPQFDVLTSRATARLATLFELLAPFMAKNTRMLLHKGREYGEELAETNADWQADVIALPSETDAEGVLLDIRHLERKSA